MAIGHTLAKELFMKYGGNTFLMDREGELVRYRECSVSDAQEDEWREEYRSDILRRITTESGVPSLLSRYLLPGKLFARYDALEPILSLLEQRRATLDSFSKLRCAETLINEIRPGAPQSHHPSIMRAHRIARDFFNDVIVNPISIADEYREVGYLKDVLEDAKIRERARRGLARW